MHILFLPAQYALLKGRDTTFELREKSIEILGDICKDHTVLVAFTDAWLNSMICSKDDPMFNTKKMLFDALIKYRIPLCGNYNDIAVRTHLKIDPETDPRFKANLEKSPKGTWVQLCINGPQLANPIHGDLRTNPHTIFITAAWGLSAAAASRIDNIFYSYEEENKE